MTTLAWDGKTLAADKLSSDSGLARRITKVFKHKSGLYAASGHAGQALMMIEWLTVLNRQGACPVPKAGEESFVTFINPEGKIFRFDDCDTPIHFEEKIFACGSGRDFALAAMHCGKTAVEAVEIASLFDISTGLGVDFFTLDDL